MPEEEIGVSVDDRDRSSFQSEDPEVAAFQEELRRNLERDESPLSEEKLEADEPERELEESVIEEDGKERNPETLESQKGPKAQEEPQEEAKLDDQSLAELEEAVEEAPEPEPEAPKDPATIEQEAFQAKLFDDIAKDEFVPSYDDPEEEGLEIEAIGPNN